MKTKEYLVVKDENGNPVGRKEIESKVMAENVFGYIINGSILKSISEFNKMQEEAKNLPDLEK